MSVSMSSCMLRKAFSHVLDHLSSKNTEIAFFFVRPFNTLYANSSKSFSYATFFATAAGCCASSSRQPYTVPGRLHSAAYLCLAA
jgi:hypothetical protein